MIAHSSVGDEITEVHVQSQETKVAVPITKARTGYGWIPVLPNGPSLAGTEAGRLGQAAIVVKYRHFTRSIALSRFARVNTLTQQLA
jgi:hypothetical protein